MDLKGCLQPIPRINANEKDITPIRYAQLHR
jgi:hypothetical protein